MMPRIQRDARISRRSPRRRGKAPVGWVVGGCAWALLVAFGLAGPLARVVHAVTGGHRGADLVAGAVLFFVPLAAAGTTAWWKWRHDRPVWPAMFWLALLAPAVALAPYYHGVPVDQPLAELLNRTLPGLETGMSIGFVAFVVLALLAVTVTATLRGRQSRRRRETK